MIFLQARANLQDVLREEDMILKYHKAEIGRYWKTGDPTLLEHDMYLDKSVMNFGILINLCIRVLNECNC